MNPVFKPRKQQIHVPGHGVVQKEDFNEGHFKILMRRAGENKDVFIKQYFEVASYGDQPLFQDGEEGLNKKSKKQLAAEEKQKKEKEEADLLAQMEEEEATNKGKKSTDKEDE